jgi:TDG/mug DNA glycosylase family protein
MTEKLPDLLGPHLAVVFVGTAARRRSAEIGAYYAGRGNRFWRTLHEVGITARQYEPHECRDLLALGIGFTDVSKVGSAFTSKRATALWLRTPSTAAIALGRHDQRSCDFPEVFVLPSPSGAATRYWDLRPWRELAAWLNATKPASDHWPAPTLPDKLPK